jgi:hypothetical protein
MSHRSRRPLLTRKLPDWRRIRRQIQRLPITHAQRSFLVALVHHWEDHPVACQEGRLLLGLGQPNERWRSKDGRERIRGGRPGIADLGGMSRRHALRCRHVLEQRGLLRVRPGGGRGKANAYELHKSLSGLDSWMDREPQAAPPAPSAPAPPDSPGRQRLREEIQRLRRGPPAA